MAQTLSKYCTLTSRRQLQKPERRRSFVKNFEVSKTAVIVESVALAEVTSKCAYTAVA